MVEEKQPSMKTFLGVGNGRAYDMDCILDLFFS